MPQPDRPIPEVAGVLDAAAILATGRSIAGAQESSGAIPWFPGGHTDPWDHTECAMAMLVCGLRSEADAAYDYLRRTQRADGTWPAKVTEGVEEDAEIETNQCAYLAVGVWHHFLITRDEAHLMALWPTVRTALDLVTTFAEDRGEIAWSVTPEGEPRTKALLTGSSSINQALRCGLAIADHLDEPQPEWELAAGRLAHVIADHPEAFMDKSRFSMDWYYPVLGGAVRGAAAERRFTDGWDTFVVPGLGVRCVEEEPWVTGAESAECVIALDCAGLTEQALELFASIQHLRDDDGAYWTGWQFANSVNWPAEHSTWTAAAVVLAADALSRTTPASGIFRADSLPLGLALGDAPCGCTSRDAISRR